MKTTSGVPSDQPPFDPPSRRRFLGWPGTRLGWWSVGLAAGHLGLTLLNGALFMSQWVQGPLRQSVGPFFGIAMLLCGLSAGVVALLALVRRRERSVLVWLAVLPGLSGAMLVLGELLVPH